MNGLGARAGHPLIVLGLLASSWIVLRVVVWHTHWIDDLPGFASEAAPESIPTRWSELDESPVAPRFSHGGSQRPTDAVVPATSTSTATATATASGTGLVPPSHASLAGRPLSAPVTAVHEAPFAPNAVATVPVQSLSQASLSQASLSQAFPSPESRPQALPLAPSEPDGSLPIRYVVAHHSMMIDAMAFSADERDAVAAMAEAPRRAQTRQPPAQHTAGIVLSALSRPAGARDGSLWSADGWLLVRGGSDIQSSASVPTASLPAYGTSQAGVVLRYRLATESERHPAFYLRGTTRLGSDSVSGFGWGDQAEAAFGLSARPMRQVPVVAGAEVRMRSNSQARLELRPAILAHTQLAPVQLPLDLRADAYLQAGYVGGSDARAFADGQLRLDREAARLGRHRFRLGAGVWGGAQRGAARLDVGPAARFSLDFGEWTGSVVLDYRIRVAGEAEPGDGAAITLITGF